MDADRFKCYIAGGTPVGGTREYVGCDDTTPPVADRAIELPRQLYFAGESKVWTGGIAFIGHEASDEPTKARAYLITAQQFAQVAAQESHQETFPSLDLGRIRKSGRYTINSGNYGELLYFDELEGYRMVSFTSTVERRPYTKPSPAYLKMIAAGLRKAHDLSAEEAASYLAAKPGIQGNYSVEALEAISQPSA